MDKKRLEKFKKYRTPIFIAGDSQTGKTSSYKGFRNKATGQVIVEGLDKEKTLILRTDSKKVMGKPSEKEINITSYVQLDKILDGFVGLDRVEFNPDKETREQWDRGTGAMKKVEFIIIDSFTSVLEQILENAMLKYSHGQQAWGEYANMAIQLIDKLHSVDAQVILLGISSAESDSGIGKHYVRVQGNVLQRGGIERRLNIILYTKPVYNMDGELEETANNVVFQYRPNIKNSASSPAGMFTGTLPADMAIVMEQIYEYTDSI